MPFNSMVGVPIKHPDWVLGASGDLTRTMALYAKRQIPGCIEAPLVVVPVKRILRGVYGSDLRAALALLTMALQELPSKIQCRIREFVLFTVLGIDRQAYYDRKMRELEEEDDE